MTESTQLVQEQELKKQIEQTILDHKDLIVKDDPGYVAACEAMKLIKKRQKDVKEYWGPLVKKAHEMHKELKGKENGFMNPLKEVYGDISSRASKYQSDKQAEAERKQREEEARQRKIEEDKKLEEAESLQDQGRPEEAEAVLCEPVNIAPPPLQSAPKVDKVSYTEYWSFRITNEALIPREFLIPDEKMLRQHAKTWKSKAKVAGVEFYCEKRPRING